VRKESDWSTLEERGERERKKRRNKRGWLVGVNQLDGKVDNCFLFCLLIHIFRGFFLF
jgi:hypothetical protein